jgi:hypothetical protein
MACLATPASLHRPRRSAQIAIEPAAPSTPHIPRFRALALLGRRPSERVAAVRTSASEKPAQLLTSLLTLDRIVGLSLLIEGYVRAMGDGEAFAPGYQH